MRRTTILNAEEIKRTPLKDAEATFYSEFQNSRLARVLQLLHRAGIHEADKRQAHERRGDDQRDLHGRRAATAAKKAGVQQLGGMENLGGCQLPCGYRKQSQHGY